MWKTVSYGPRFWNKRSNILFGGGYLDPQEQRNKHGWFPQPNWSQALQAWDCHHQLHESFLEWPPGAVHLCDLLLLSLASYTWIYRRGKKLLPGDPVLPARVCGNSWGTKNLSVIFNELQDHTWTLSLANQNVSWIRLYCLRKVTNWIHLIYFLLYNLSGSILKSIRAMVKILFSRARLPGFGSSLTRC